MPARSVTAISAEASGAGESRLTDVALAVADHIPAMLAYWDRDQKCRFANAAYREWFGRTREQLLGISMQELLGPIYPKNQPYIENALAGKRQEFEREIPLPDGTIRQSIATYIPDVVDGVVHGFFVHVADATALKNAERALARERDELLRSNQILERLGAILAHDFKAPLRRIGQFTALLARRLPKPLPEPIAEMTGFIEKEVLRLSGMSDAMLRLAQARGEQAVRADCDLKQVVADALAALALPIAERRARVSAGPLPHLKCDAAQVGTVVQNLVQNALKYAIADPVVVDIHAIEAADSVTLVVDDNGPGIPEASRREIFDPFTRLASDGEGIGIGLSTCEAIAKAHGAAIWVESSPSGGASFRIRFPR